MKRNDIVVVGGGEKINQIGEAIEIGHLNATHVLNGLVIQREVVPLIFDQDRVIEPLCVFKITRIHVVKVVTWDGARHGERRLEAEEDELGRIEVEVELSIALNDRVRALTHQERVTRVEDALGLNHSHRWLLFY